MPSEQSGVSPESVRRRTVRNKNAYSRPIATAEQWRQLRESAAAKRRALRATRRAKRTLQTRNSQLFLSEPQKKFDFYTSEQLHPRHILQNQTHIFT